MVNSVEIIIIVLLVIIVFSLRKRLYGLRFLPANSSDWLVLEWHKIDDDGSWDSNEPVHIEFVPIIGWTYDHWGFKYGQPTPITPPSYHVASRLEKKNEYETLSYWIRDGESFEISDYWTHAGDFWESLADYAVAESKIEIRGAVPNCCRKRLFNIIKDE